MTTGTTAIVTGASRGFGRGIASALAKAGMHVVRVARDAAALDEVREQLGSAFTPVAADAADPVLAGQLIDRYLPRTLVLNAGAVPLPRPVHRHTWQTFSRNQAGKEIAGLITDPGADEGTYLLTAAGLNPVP